MQRYAIVTDVTPSRATVLFVGTASEIVDVFDGETEIESGETVGEQDRVVEVETDSVLCGERLWHAGEFVAVDSLRR